MIVRQNVAPPPLLQMQLAQKQMGSLFESYQMSMAPQMAAQNNELPEHFFSQ
jgi:hypothetical protein